MIKSKYEEIALYDMYLSLYMRLEFPNINHWTIMRTFILEVCGRLQIFLQQIQHQVRHKINRNRKKIKKELLLQR